MDDILVFIVNYIFIMFLIIYIDKYFVYMIRLDIRYFDMIILWLFIVNIVYYIEGWIYMMLGL